MNEATVKEDKTNVLDFMEKRKALATGGGGSAGMEWLTNMKMGSEFLVRPLSQKTWVLAKFMFAGNKIQASYTNTLLIPMKGESVSQDESEWMWVDPVEFCKFWEFRGYILVPEDE